MMWGWDLRDITTQEDVFDYSIFQKLQGNFTIIISGRLAVVWDIQQYCKLIQQCCPPRNTICLDKPSLVD